LKWAQQQPEDHGILCHSYPSLPIKSSIAGWGTHLAARFAQTFPIGVEHISALIGNLQVFQFGIVLVSVQMIDHFNVRLIGVTFEGSGSPSSNDSNTNS
jgi:hypothetical protein